MDWLDHLLAAVLAAVAGLAGIAFRRENRFDRMVEAGAGPLVEAERDGALKIRRHVAWAGAGTSVVAALTVGAMAFWGVGAPTEVEDVVAPPDPPSVDVVVFAATGDSVRVFGSGYSGDGADPHDSTWIQVDTAGGDFSSPAYHDVVLGAVTADTALVDSGAVAKARIQYKGAEGGWSEWSDTLQFEAVVAGVTHANEPGGFTQAAVYDFESSLPGGWSANANRNGSTFTLGTDGGAPLDPSGIGQINYSTSYSGGSDPATVYTPMPPTAEVYMHFGFKVSANWTPHGSGVNKVFFLTDDDTSGGGNPIYFAFFGNSFPLEFQVREQGSPGGAANHGPNMGGAGAAEIGADEWIELEVHIVNNTPGSSDGEIHVWSNGTKTHEYTGMSFVAGGTDGLLDNLRWEPTWGGIGGTPTNGMFQAMDYLYISVPE